MNLSSINGNGSRNLSFTLRDFVAIGFRHQRVMVLCFVGVFMGTLLSALLLPATYRAETKILVKKERLDPVVSPEQNAPMMFKDSVSEEDLNSEVELIGSEDVLRKVVDDCGLASRKSLFNMLGFGQSQDMKTAKAVRRLKAELMIEPIKKSNMISVAYESSNPQLAAHVLDTLNSVYIQKHLEVHHPSGQAKFFDQETEQYRKALEDTEAQLKAFDQQTGGVAPAAMRDLTLEKLAEFNGSLQTTRAQIHETETRIRDLEGQQTSTPSRLTTQMRKGDDPQVLQQLKGTLVTLELKKTELLTKYQPTYPLVVEVDKQIADTKATLAKEEGTPIKEETTDQNPTFSWINGELAKAKADLSGLRAKESATQAIVDLYSTNAKALDEKGITQQDLLRTQKANEANYLLYLKKGEEARIADALDQSNILNVAVTQPPSVPALPSRSPWLLGIMGFVLALVASVGVALTLDYMDQSFRTPSEVTAELGIPVLAAVPHHGRTSAGYGNGNGNGFGGGEAVHPVSEESEIQSVRLG
ncbi:MAG TPA: GumC family protein [Candidatus Sulfotelmatobacter sp.]|jgi:uncharacterized protein involved in exopolysaccharide biosynthesis|nr:GumC family protein [Candidatus Sulfotelmatobacter sp.]